MKKLKSEENKYPYFAKILWKYDLFLVYNLSTSCDQNKWKKYRGLIYYEIYGDRKIFYSALHAKRLERGVLQYGQSSREEGTLIRPAKDRFLGVF